jgi:orotidine-5'-phosphate decarboxylase
MTFTQKLYEIQNQKDSLLCIGLDVDLEKIPKFLLTHKNPVLEFNRQIIEATSDLVCAFKPNLAFYEALGEQGLVALRETLKFIPKNIISLGDGKRGDIGNTSERYAKSLFSDFGFDAITVNPYMGSDSVEPFIQSSDRGIFVLTLTSNPGSRDFQRLKVGSKPLYEKVAQATKKWNSNQNIGLVVGATHPKELQRIRRIVPDVPILIPGIGKQGGDLRSAVQYGCAKQGRLAIINASRSIIYASDGTDFAEAARIEAKKMLTEIRTFTKK